MLTADVYIDTSIKGPKRRAGRYMYIIGVPEDGKYRQSAPQSGRVEDTTENYLTLTALEKALSHFKKPFRLNIYLESQYVFGVLENRTFEKWEQAGWLTAKNTPVANREIWQNILKLLNKHEYQVFYKTPHSNSEWMKWTLKEE